MTGLIAIVLVIVFANPTYAKPYGNLVGQLVLFAATVLLVALLVWTRHLTQPTRRRRFLTGTSNAPPARPAAASGARQQEVALR